MECSLSVAEYDRRHAEAERGRGRVVTDWELYKHFCSHMGPECDVLPNQQDAVRMAITHGYAIRDNDGRLFLLCCPDAPIGMLVL